MTQPIPRGPTDRACALFSDLIAGRWENVDGEFDASLRGQVDLARGWTGVVDAAGAFERIDAPSARQFGGYTVVDVPLAFAAGGAIGEVVFDPGRPGRRPGTGIPLSSPAFAAGPAAPVGAGRKASRVHRQEPRDRRAHAPLSLTGRLLVPPMAPARRLPSCPSTRERKDPPTRVSSV
jgi:hypothetical protein